MIKQRIRTHGIGRNVVRNLNTFHDPNVTLPTRDHLEAHIFISLTLMPFIGFKKEIDVNFFSSLIGKVKQNISFV